MSDESNNQFTVKVHPYPIMSMEIPPRISGLYFLTKNGVVVYVGKSGDVYARVISHRRTHPEDFDGASFMAIPEPEMHRLELYYIGLLCPPLNKTSGESVRNSERQRFQKFLCHNLSVIGNHEHDPFALDYLDPKRNGYDVDKNALCESETVRFFWRLSQSRENFRETGESELADQILIDSKKEAGCVAGQ